MATATDMVWVELSRERTKRGEITFGISGKSKEPRGLIAAGDPHWAQAIQALDAAPLSAPGAKGKGSPPPVITLIPREAVMKYQAALAAAGTRKGRS
jgi:hypothetical protein